MKRLIFTLFAALLAAPIAAQTTPAHPDRFVAVAMHTDAGDVWATWNQRSDEAAKKAALDACNGVMRGGCTIAQSGFNSSVAVARRHDRGIAVSWGATPEVARTEAMQSCGKMSPKCELIHMFTAAPSSEGRPRDYFPDNRVPRNHYAFLAWPKEPVTNQWRNKAWVASGYGYDALQKQLLERCRQDSGAECIISQVAVNDAVIVKHQNETGQDWWITFPSRERAEERISTEECARIKRTSCKVVAIYDTRTPRIIVEESAPGSGG